MTPTRECATGLQCSLYNYRARYYQPHLARFIAEDPIGHAGGPNLYSYVDDNPISYVDPLGHAKGGKQKMETQLRDGRIINLKTPQNVVEKILQDAAKKIIEIPPGQIKTLEQILKIISRGGTLAILIVNELLDPREAGAGSERMLPPVPPLGCRKDCAY